jgi:hypothetical protein
VLVKAHHCNTPKLRELVTNAIPGSKLQAETRSEVTFLLPDSESYLFADLFQLLEGKQSQLGVTNFGVTATTLEDVFLK